MIQFKLKACVWALDYERWLNIKQIIRRIEVLVL